MRILSLLLVLLFSTRAAAQPVAGAFEVPLGDWEYRWVTRNDGAGNVRREPAAGYLRLDEGGRHTHQRDAEGASTSSFGRFAVEGYTLYLPYTDMDHGGRAAVDTFLVRHIGDRMYLFQQHGDASLEYTLAPAGTPAEPAVVPGLVPSLQGFATSIAFFESDGGPLPRPQRRYATEFQADSVRYLNVEINLSHPISLADGTLPVECAFEHAESGGVVPLAWNGQMRRGNASTGLSTGMGTAQPGAWPAGTYAVRCTVEGVPMPEAGFVIR